MLKLTKLIQEHLKNFFTTNLSLKILSLILAILLWLYLKISGK